MFKNINELDKNNNYIIEEINNLIKNDDLNDLINDLINNYVNIMNKMDFKYKGKNNISFRENIGIINNQNIIIDNYCNDNNFGLMNNQINQICPQKQMKNQIFQQNQMNNKMNNQIGFQSQVGLRNNMNNNPMMNQMNHGKSKMPKNQKNQFMQQQQQQQQQEMLQQQQEMLQQQEMMQQAMMQQAMMQQVMLAQQQVMMQQAMLAQQQANQGNNSAQSPISAIVGSFPNSSPEENQISVIFDTSALNELNEPLKPFISITCMPNEKVSTLIQRYRNKAFDHDQTRQFIFNSKNLNPELTLSAAGIVHNSKITVIS